MGQDEQLDQARRWVWVIAHKQGETEGLLALTDKDGVSFLPVFATKEDGLVNQGRVPPSAGGELEVQAMELGEVIEMGRRDGYQVVLVDERGQVSQVLTADQ